jgi:hypothetical protein
MDPRGSTRSGPIWQQQQALAEAAAREERQRIARELHDIISHGLGVAVLQAGAAEQVLERDPGKARDALRLIRATGQEAITELGTLVALIHDDQPPGRDPQPTLRDVELLVATTSSAGLAVNVQTEGGRGTCPLASSPTPTASSKKGSPMRSSMQVAPPCTWSCATSLRGSMWRSVTTTPAPGTAPAPCGACPACKSASRCSVGGSRPDVTHVAAGESTRTSPLQHD